MLESYYSLLSKYLSTTERIMLQCQTSVHAINFIVANKKTGNGMCIQRFISACFEAEKFFLSTG